MLSTDVEALASKLENVFSMGRPGAAVHGDALLELVASVFPGLPAEVSQARDKEGAKDKPKDEPALVANRAAATIAIRAAGQRLARRALAAAAPPLQWAPAGAPGPALCLFLDCMYSLGQAGYTDVPATALTMTLLEDVADAMGGDDCGDVLAFLTEREEVLRSSRDTKMPVLRLCNRLLARLSRASEPKLCAEVLVFLAKVFPLNERSGLNVAGLLSPALISDPEEVAPDAADSSGQPIDALLYATTWGLQPLLHNPRAAAEPVAWTKFVGDVRTVLAALATQPAQVAAGGGGDGGGAAGAADGAAGSSGGGEGTVGYLSSPQLFGLQLRDAAFRRSLLVQVLVLLQAVREPVRFQDVALRAKQAQEAAALEREVYGALEATPDNGKAFATAVRSILAREEGWIQWKRGGPPPVSMAVAKHSDKLPACPEFAAPPMDPGVDQRVAAGEAAAAAAAAKAQARRETILAALALEKRSALEMTTDELLEPRKKIKTDSDVLRGVSRLDDWVHHVPDSNMAGLKVTERPGFPTLELLARPALEQMDPESCVEDPYRLVRTDQVYRWRIARLMARAWPGSHHMTPLPKWTPPSVKDGLTSADPAMIEQVLGRVLPDKVPQGWVEQQMVLRNAEAAAAEAAKAAEEAKAAKQPADKAKQTKAAGAAAATPKGGAKPTGPAGGAGDAAAGAAAGGGSGGGGGGSEPEAGEQDGGDAEASNAGAGAEAALAGEAVEDAGAAAAAGGGDAPMADAEAAEQGAEAEEPVEAAAGADGQGEAPEEEEEEEGQA